MKIQGSPLVKASYDELVSFIRHYRHHGTPTIIGGWAVWFYNPYFGSIDIDVVGPSYKGEFYRIIEEYEHTHGYQTAPTDLFGVEAIASKPIISEGKKVGDMEIDACSFEQPGAGEFHEDRSLTLPYSLCNEPGNKREVKIARDCVCYAPSKALLTMFKVKAYRDRSYDIRSKGATMNPERLVWLRTKVAKDATDIIALLDPRGRGGLVGDKMDYGQLRQIAKARGLEALTKETLGAILGSKEALVSYGKTVNLRAVKASLGSVFHPFG
ncbi:MAG: hypothetical protein JRN13_03050 [Nitrososphaerota archaeon]|nr:hypothetical protein [Nitrososphaerota archaeon]MDG6969451.1 hypothetical protein [Nitrososphaerota archaeon]MDG6971221.1 hypothetical protein [Nitrososphaerota archaeon]MDG6972299.1 hypothetical protein [Nitrososphaerota archaeon]MDG6973986.1 hypothetical protein [Nitrososphaerota archaeon]